MLLQEPLATFTQYFPEEHCVLVGYDVKVYSEVDTIQVQLCFSSPRGRNCAGRLQAPGTCLRFKKKRRAVISISPNLNELSPAAKHLWLEASSQQLFHAAAVLPPNNVRTSPVM